MVISFCRLFPISKATRDVDQFAAALAGDSSRHFCAPIQQRLLQYGDKSAPGFVGFEAEVKTRPRPRLSTERPRDRLFQLRGALLVKRRGMTGYTFFSSLGALLLFLAHLAVVVRVILRPHREPASRIAWITIILVLPGVGMIFYLLLGETNIGRRRAHRLQEVLAGMPRLGDAPGLIH